MEEEKEKEEEQQQQQLRQNGERTGATSVGREGAPNSLAKSMPMRDRRAELKHRVLKQCGKATFLESQNI